MLRRSQICSLYRSTSVRLLTVIKMPALSPTMEKGTLVAWDLKIGDKIEENTCLAKVQTDKATNDFNYVGDECFLARFIQEAGAVVTVGDAVALAVEEASQVNSDEVKNWKPAVKKPSAAAPVAPAPIKSNPSSPDAASQKSAASNEKLSHEMIEIIERSGPAVLRLASSLTSDQIRSLLKDGGKKATGLGNRFTKSDVLGFFPKVDFSVPNPESPFVHSSSSSSVSSPAPTSVKTAAATAEAKSQPKKQNDQKGFEISQLIQPGVPGKFGIHDDDVLAFLMKKK